MPIEHPPKPELPVNYRPDDSAPIYVGGLRGGTPNDTWETVADQYRMNVKDLIRFNFRTINPDEVNWYLRRRVGCRVPSSSGNNWTFRNADPGMIYIPELKIRFGPTVIGGNPGFQVDWRETAKELEKMFTAGIWSVAGKVLDIVSAADLAMAFAEVGLPIGWTVGMAGASVAAVMLAIGSPHLDAFNKVRKEQVLWGYSYGVLMGVDKKTMDFIQSMGLHRRLINSPVYPEREKDFQAAYKVGLAMDQFPSELSDWKISDWRRYYVDGAIVFRRRMLQK